MVPSLALAAAFIALGSASLPKIDAFSTTGFARSFVGAATSTTSSKSTAILATLQQLDDSNMKDLLFRPPDGRAVLVDAYAPWCGPCKLIEPYLGECAKKYEDQLSVIKYDVEGSNNKNLKVEMLLQGVMIRGLPTLLLYSDGNPVATHSGAITESDLGEWIEGNLSSIETTADTSNQKMEGSVKNDAGSKKEEGDGGKKRGFVSFAFGRDDYAL